MEEIHDTIAELAAVTAEMAEMQDIGAKRLSDLIDRRGALIRHLIVNEFDANDPRLAAIVADADRLQEKLRKRADSIRVDIETLRATDALMSAVRSTLNTPVTTTTLNVSA